MSLVWQLNCKDFTWFDGPASGRRQEWNDIQAWSRRIHEKIEPSFLAGMIVVLLVSSSVVYLAHSRQVAAEMHLLSWYMRGKPRSGAMHGRHPRLWSAT